MFRLSTMDVGQTPPIEYHPVTDGKAVALGEALTVTAGALTKCGASVRPDYIAVGPSRYGIAPVIKVQDYMIFETELTAAGAALKPGDKLTISDDGLHVTATTGGVAAIVSMNGTALGDTVNVRFCKGGEQL